MPCLWSLGAPVVFCMGVSSWASVFCSCSFRTPLFPGWGSLLMLLCLTGGSFGASLSPWACACSGASMFPCWFSSGTLVSTWSWERGRGWFNTRCLSWFLMACVTLLVLPTTMKDISPMFSMLLISPPVVYFMWMWMLILFPDDSGCCRFASGDDFGGCLTSFLGFII